MIVGSRGDIANFKGVQPSARASSHVLPDLLYQKSHDSAAFAGVYGIRYNGAMKYIVKQTGAFAQWRSGLTDLKTVTAIRRRMERAQAGNLGDVKAVGGGVPEMRIDVGAGYRVYFTIRNRQMLFLLAGGDKSTQTTDIRNAIDLAKEV